MFISFLIKKKMDHKYATGMSVPIDQKQEQVVLEKLEIQAVYQHKNRLF